MAKGRLPKENATRRGGRKPNATQELTATSISDLTVPPNIAENPVALECWEWIVSGGQKYRMEDVPLLSELAEWWAISRQCSANIMGEDGSIITTVKTPTGDKANPDIRTKALATTHIRHLSGELGVGPLARMRMGLMDATTKSLTVDIADRIAEAMKRQKALNK